PIFRFVPAGVDSSLNLLERFDAAITSAAALRPASLAAIESSARAFGVALTPDESAYLASPTRRERMVATIRRVFDRWLAGGVVASGAVDRLRGEVLLRRGTDERRLPVDSLLSFNQLVSWARLLDPDPRSPIGQGLYLKLITT